MEDIICPKCKTWNRPNDNWDFIDGETHSITCSECGKKFEIVIERPIEYYVLGQDN